MRVVTLMFTVVALLLASGICFAQSVYLGIGAAGYASTTPHSAINLTAAVGDASGKTALYTTAEARGVVTRDPKTIVYSVRTGLRQVVAASGNVQVFALALGGGSVTPEGPAASFSGGGGLSYNPKLIRLPGLRFSLTAQALGTGAGVGWEPLIGFQVGYVFRKSE